MSVEFSEEKNTKTETESTAYISDTPKKYAMLIKSTFLLVLDMVGFIGFTVFTK